LEPVFRGKKHTLLHDRLEEVIRARFLLLQSLGSDRQQGKGRLRAHLANRPAELAGGLRLSLGAIGDNAQVHVALGTGLAPRVRPEQIDGPNMADAIEGFQAASQRLSLWFQRLREIVQQ